jgi:hypothetical protein
LPPVCKDVSNTILLVQVRSLLLLSNRAKNRY